MKNTATALLVLLVVTPLAWSEEVPRTGFFRKAITPEELLGAEGAKAVSTVFAPDETLTWQLSVPDNYDPAKPAGVMVFIGWGDWGSGKKAWTSVLEEKNLIWIGLIGGGDKHPLNERLLKGILAQAVLEQEYKINLDRYYLFGYSGGAHVAAMLATSRPELFKGAFYFAGALSWGKNSPPKIDLVKQNRFMFMAGSLDKNRGKIKEVADAYKRAGVSNTEFVLVSNVERKFPGVSYFQRAVTFLDERPATETLE